MGHVAQHEGDLDLPKKEVHATTFGIGPRRLRDLNQYFGQRGVVSRIRSKQEPTPEPFSVSSYLSELPFLADS
jgi:hypothetical protein